MNNPEFNIESYITSLIDAHHSIDIAESEFRKNLAEDPDLRRTYGDWCDEMGYTERHGFKDFCHEYLDNLDSVWDSLTDYDE